jgi:hypothetical protein
MTWHVVVTNTVRMYVVLTCNLLDNKHTVLRDARFWQFHSLNPSAFPTAIHSDVHNYFICPGEEMVFRDQWGGISLLNAANLTTRSLMTNQTFVSFLFNIFVTYQLHGRYIFDEFKTLWASVLETCLRLRQTLYVQVAGLWALTS